MSDSSLFLSKPTKPSIHTRIALNSSKSESNRALIINALAKNLGTLHNLSEARDTRTMLRLLQSTDQTLDVIDAGTTMRFLTAYVAATNQDKIMTGTARMCERPIALLVDALRKLGAHIEYLEKEGFPPIHIKGLTPNGVNEISIRGDVSSQYISALLMIAPTLPTGLTLELTGNIGSRPYIEMTLGQMEQFGIQYTWQGNRISILPQEYQATEYQVESDWSGASYWYSIVALAPEAEIELLRLKPNSLQGDSRIVSITAQMGVRSEFTENGVRLTKIPYLVEAEVDFTDCPDLAQTVAVLCAAKGISLTLTGIESLKIKETDRIAALQQELAKFGAKLVETSSQVYKLSPITKFPTNPVTIDTYDDHRMAMAFAPLALLQDITIRHPEVVVKSYPSYWEDLKKAGFVVK